MSDAKLVNLAKLMTTYNFEIEQLPDHLKCAQCKLVLKNACQMPCGCRFCRACINDIMARGGRFCPGNSEDCGESLLSRNTVDYVANKNVSKLAVKCPHDGCVHECRLDNMEEHLRECQRRSQDCPFRELGCTQDKMAAEEMGGHLQDESHRHSEILIAMMANMKREIETLKRREEASSREIEKLKHELELKDEQSRTFNFDVSKQITSIQALVGLGQVDARFECLIDFKTRWEDRLSEYFTGVMQPYKYRLVSDSDAEYCDCGALTIVLRIDVDSTDKKLKWPLIATVAITVADRDRRELSTSIAKLCRFTRPKTYDFRCSDYFRFYHSKLRGAGLNLSRGARVTCVVAPQSDDDNDDTWYGSDSD